MDTKKISNLLTRALHLEFLTAEEGLFLFENAPTASRPWQ